MSKATRRDLARTLELHKAGSLAEAEKGYASYLAAHPDDPAALNNAAAAALQLGNPALAIKRFEKLVALDPRHAHGYNNLGYALIQDGRSGEAVRCLERAVEIEPRLAIAHNNLGIAYENLFRRADAIGSFERALALQPQYADAAANLGEVLNRDGDTTRARAMLHQALRAQPSHFGARVALTAADALDGKLEDALATLERIVPSVPPAPRFWQALGSLRAWSGDLIGSEAAYRRALALDPHDQLSWLGIGGSQLARGDFARGWRAFEERPEGCFGAPSRFRDIAQWDGGRLDGALLIVCEQGLGDVVQFARLVPDARLRVRRLIFLADANWRTLAPLLATLRGIDDLCTDAAALATAPERPVARASVLSLPYLLGLRVEGLPGPVPYISPLAERAEMWRPRLEAISRPRIGLAWAAYARRDIGYITRQKSVPPELLAPVIAATRASFVSLQLGAAGKLAPEGELAARIVDLTADIGDFGDTAAIMSELDLVISSDTSVAHVAGAMGKPTWMLDRYNTDWRWRLAENRSPWYPTMRIFRQQRFGDWHEPIARVAAALGQLYG
jgi:tetratricopeptide (TPR) repeat protein